MTGAGYTEVEIVPSSFLVSAKNKDGNKVLMRVWPELDDDADRSADHGHER